MKTNKNKKKPGSKPEKRGFKFENQGNNEIIDKQELKKRHGITGDKEHYFITHLRKYHLKEIHHDYPYNLTGLAEYIAEKEELYISDYHSFKLMKTSSILTGLRKLNKQVKEEIEREKEAKNKRRKRDTIIKK